MLLVVFGAVVVLVLVCGRSAPPRFRRIRGAPMWTTHEDAQRAHLDHFRPVEEPEEDGQ